MPRIDRRILIADLAYLGDTLMTSPVIVNLRRNHPNAVIDFLVADQSAVVVAHHPDLNQVLIVDRARYRDWSDGGYFRYLVDRLKDKRYDTAFVVHRAPRTALLCAMARIPTRIGLATQSRRLLLTKAVALDPRRHRTDNALALLEAVGERVTTRTLSFTPAPGSAQRAEGLLDTMRWDPARLTVALAPGGSWETKRWPLDRWSKVARTLLAGGAQVLVVGGPAETAMGQALSQATGDGVLNLIGATGFDELYEIFRRCGAVIAMDSGPMHLAAASGVPLVALFGPTSPGRCGPRSDTALTVAGEVPCLGCYFKACAHHSCMEFLAPNTVLQGLDTVIARAIAREASAPSAVELD